MKKFNKIDLLKYDFDKMPQSWTKKLPFKKTDLLVCLGEFSQAPGHGIFVNVQTGKLYCGYHVDEFRKATEEEV